jgi:SAM-dependent methyltransferase
MQPLANNLPKPSESVEMFPLNLVRCWDCGLLQIKETIPPDVLFSNYLYFSSFADALLQNARSLVNSLLEKRQVKKGDFVVEVGSNDGYLLQFYRPHGVRVMGVEPASNVAEVAIHKNGVPTKVAFFDDKIASDILKENGPAMVIHANNVLAHTASLHSVIEGIALLLADQGVAVMEVQYFKDMVDRGSFDMIYHEHLCYYTLDTFQKLLSLHGLKIVHGELIGTHGGSLRVYACRASNTREESKEIIALRNDENSAGVNTMEYYKKYADRVVNLKNEILNLLRKLNAQNKRVVAYGAAAKATVMFNYLGIDSDLIGYVIDRNPHKQGRYIPGTDVLVEPMEKMLTDPPDYVFISAWNLADEIISQLTEYVKPDLRFVVPFPKVTIL